jgi:hypothetical protein
MNIFLHFLIPDKKNVIKEIERKVIVNRCSVLLSHYLVNR